MPEKICVLCGKSCAGDPRTKDPKGRYYHTSCYEEARAKKRKRDAARQAAGEELTMPAAPTPQPFAEQAEAGGGADPLGMGDLLTGVDTSRTCPGCGAGLASDAVICMSCGYNFATGSSVETEIEQAKADGRAERPRVTLPQGMLGPVTITLAIIVALGIFYTIALANDGVSLAYVVVSIFFHLIMTVAVLVYAFRESALHGVLSLMVPCYILFFAIALLESRTVKVLYFVSIIACALWFTLFDFSELMEWPELREP